MAYFYFDFNDGEKQLNDKMARSLIKQLSAYYGLELPLDACFETCGQGSRQPTLDEFLATFREMMYKSRETFIVLDALDECNEQEELLTAIETICGWKMEKLHTLVTSRKERDIEEVLDSLADAESKVDIQSALVNDDICLYIRNRLQNDRGLASWCI